jgi:isoprenylcysteine carboxyl methyltransferase (ICMT) family protein YpbQ
MPPANQEYMVAAYVVAAVVLVAYAVLLAVRVRRAARREPQ